MRTFLTRSTGFQWGQYDIIFGLKNKLIFIKGDYPFVVFNVLVYLFIALGYKLEFILDFTNQINPKPKNKLELLRQSNKQLVN